jgi:hypothetical protein
MMNTRLGGCSSFRFLDSGVTLLLVILEAAYGAKKSVLSPG